MKTYLPGFRTARLALVMVAALCGARAAAQLKDPGVPTSVPGDIMLSVPHGLARAEVDQMASSVNAAVVRFYGTLDFAQSMDSYLLHIPGNVTTAQTATAIDKIKADRRVRYAGANPIEYPLDSTPNDPQYGLQWHLPLINMPQAWDLEKGESNVTVAVVDSGTDLSHPDLAARTRPDGMNFSGGAATDLLDQIPHGTHVQGIIAAVTDNAVGVAGVTWQNVKILPVRVFATGATTDDIIVQALQYAAKVGVQVVNMSLGSADTSDTPDVTQPLNQQILTMAKAGVVFSISAGNSGPNAPPGHPANMAQVDPRIFCVASCGPRKEIAFYSSQRPYTTITAPGGDDPTGGSPNDEVLSTFPVGLGSYGREQGTSMSAPVISGVLALMLSIPGVSPDQLKSVLTSTTNPHYATPRADFGFGVVDAYAALSQVAVSITINSPPGTGGKAGAPSGQAPVVETLHPIIDVSIRQVIPANLVVKLDGNAVTNYQITNIISTTTDKSGNTIPTRYDIVISRDLAPGQHELDVSGTSNTTPSRAVSDTRFINIVPHVVAQGRSLISIPYFQAGVTPEYYFGTNFALTRWLPDQQRYVAYTAFGAKDPGASFNPPDVTPHQDATSTSVYPLGLAYWADTDSIKPILTKGQPLTSNVVIPLKGNHVADGGQIMWQMVGDPFPYDVPFNALSVDTPQGRMSIGAAADLGLIVPNVYTWDPNAGYSFKTLPAGVLQAWTGHWIGVTSKSDLSLVVPPAPASQIGSSSTGTVTASSRAVTGAGGWSLRLSASSGSLRDQNNFIGISSRASAGYDRAKAPKPPMTSPFVTLGINHSDWGAHAGSYMQDLRPGGTQSWTIGVNTDQPNATVTVSWDGAYSIPRNVRLTLKDDSTGQVVDMRSRTSVSFNSGSNATGRQFTITAGQAVSAPVRISNLAVQSGGSRAVGGTIIGFTLTGDANYEVEVLNAAGAKVSTVTTRSASAGDVQVRWTGKDNGGRSLPAGTYIVQVRATGPDGTTVRAIQPFALVR